MRDSGPRCRDASKIDGDYEKSVVRIGVNRCTVNVIFSTSKRNLKKECEERRPAKRTEWTTGDDEKKRGRGRGK
jgi:hypothetical protein